MRLYRLELRNTERGVVLTRFFGAKDRWDAETRFRAMTEEWGGPEGLGDYELVSLAPVTFFQSKFFIDSERPIMAGYNKTSLADFVAW